MVSGQKEMARVEKADDEDPRFFGLVGFFARTGLEVEVWGRRKARRSFRPKPQFVCRSWEMRIASCSRRLFYGMFLFFES